MPRDRNEPYRATYEQVVERMRQEREMPQDVNPNAPPPEEGQSGEVYASQGRLYRAALDLGEPLRQARRRQPSHIYRTVVDNKIKYKGKVYTHRNLKGKLDGKRFYFEHYPARNNGEDELMVLLSTAVVQEGQLRRLPNSIMNKFHEENNRLIRDRYGDRIYEHWYPYKKLEKEKANSSEVIVDPLEPINIHFDEASTVTVDVPDREGWYQARTNADGSVEFIETPPSSPRQRTPAEDARETDEPIPRYSSLAVGHLPGDNVTILQDHTALFDDERDTLQQRYGIATDHIVGSTEHHWILDDDSVIDRRTGEITPNRMTTPNPVSHSTTLPDGTQLPDVDRVAMEQAGINVSYILGSTALSWLGCDFFISRRTREVHRATSGQQNALRRILARSGVNV